MQKQLPMDGEEGRRQIPIGGLYATIFIQGLGMDKAEFELITISN